MAQAKQQAEAELEAARLEAQQAQEALAAEAERARAEAEAEAEAAEVAEDPEPFDIPTEKELPDLNAASTAPIAPVENTSAITLPMIVAASGGAIALGVAAFVFLL